MANKKIKDKVANEATEQVKQSPVERNREALKATAIPQRSAHGKTFNKHNVLSLDELLGERHSKYRQNTEAEYSDFLDSLQFTELERHATELLEPSHHDRNILVAKLKNKFRVENSKYFNNSVLQPKLRKEISPAVARILSEGR